MSRNLDGGNAVSAKPGPGFMWWLMLAQCLAWLAIGVILLVR